MKTFLLPTSEFENIFTGLTAEIEDAYPDVIGWLGFVNYDVIEQRVIFRADIEDDLFVRTLTIEDKSLLSMVMSGSALSLQRYASGYCLHMEGLSAELLAQLNGYSHWLVSE